MTQLLLSPHWELGQGMSAVRMVTAIVYKVFQIYSLNPSAAGAETNI